MPAYHLYNDATFCIAILVLNRDFASLDSGILFSHVTQAAFEDGEKSLVLNSILDCRVCLLDLLCCEFGK